MEAKSIVSFISASAPYIPVLTAILAAFFAYLINRIMERQKAYLQRTNDQLQKLYGPLLALSTASKVAYDSFMDRYGDGKRSYFEKKLNLDDIMLWRNWVLTVFMPLNEKMESIILENIHLIENKIPCEFTIFLAHVETYKAVISLWKQEDKIDSEYKNTSISNKDQNMILFNKLSKNFWCFSRRRLPASSQESDNSGLSKNDNKIKFYNTALIDFPSTFNGRIESDFQNILSRQSKLIQYNKKNILEIIISGFDIRLRPSCDRQGKE